MFGASAMSAVTVILKRVQQGHPKAAEELLPLVYEELRKLAAAKMANERPGQTLQPTALVHEAWLRLTGNENQEWNSRGHFFSAAAEAMRRILVENARRKQREKWGGSLHRADWPEADIPDTPRDEQLLNLDQALTMLSSIRPQAAKLVELRFFGGRSVEEAAAIIGI